MIATDLRLPISLAKLRTILTEHGVVAASIFGSYARGEQTSRSDLDIFVRTRAGVSLFDIFDLRKELEHATALKVDLITKINPNFAEYIEPDMVTIEL